jgi:hypothetical protein
VPTASTVESVRLFALLQRCLLVEVFGELRWLCSCTFKWLLYWLCMIMYYPFLVVL